MGKKSLKKVSIFLSTVMLMVSMMSIMAFATPTISPDAPTKGSLTVTKEGASFKAYKVLNATKSGDAYEYAATADFTSFFGNAAYGSYTVNGIKDLNANQMTIFAENLHKFLIANTSITGIEVPSGTKTAVDLGYYVVLETSGSSNGEAVVSTPMITSVPAVSGNAWQYDITLDPKDNKPSLVKKIVDGSNKVDTSSANIGDTIKYEVKAAIPTYESTATGIKYTFTDTMSKGLTYDATTGITAKAGEHIFAGAKHGDVNAATKDYVVKTTLNADGTTTIEIDFKYDNIKAYVATGLTLSYQAILNEKAVVNVAANDGNPNSVKLEYTNNPNIAGSIKELNDKVTTYTWGIGIKKVDADGITGDLAGAEFEIRNQGGKPLGKYTYNAAGEVVVLEGNLTTDDKGMVTVVGLEEGDYYIHEVKAPEGYSLLKEPVKVTITAAKVGDNYTGAAAIEITNGNEAGSIDKVNNVEMKDGNVLFNVQIKNYAGISLPSTGGIGTDGFVKIAISLLAIVAVSGLAYLAIEKKKRA